MLSASTKPNPSTRHPPSDAPRVLHTHGTAPNTNLHRMGGRCQKVVGLEGALGAAGAEQGGAAQDKGQRRYKGAWRRAQLCHSAALLGLADPEVSQALSAFMHGDAGELAWFPEPGKNCAGAHGEPMRAPESRGWAEEEEEEGDRPTVQPLPLLKMMLS